MEKFMLLTLINNPTILMLKMYNIVEAMKKYALKKSALPCQSYSQPNVQIGVPNLKILYSKEF